MFPENSIDQGNVMDYTTKDAMALDNIGRTNLETFKATMPSEGSDKEVPALEKEFAESIEKGSFDMRGKLGRLWTSDLKNDKSLHEAYMTRGKSTAISAPSG